MKEFLIEVLNSSVTERIVDGLIICVIVMIIQYFYNKKLTEHHIQFKYWHKEKAKAIKTLYKDFTDLSSSLQKLMTFEEKENEGKDMIAKKTEAMKSLTTITRKSFDDWRMLNLYIDNDDNEKIADFFKIVSEFSDLYDQNKNNFPDTTAIQGDFLFSITLECLYALRMKFRQTLMVKDDDAEKEKKKAEKEKKKTEKGKKA